MAKFYDPATERIMRLHYSRLSEKEGRHYGAIEAGKLGWGGKRYIVNLLGLSSRTLYKGMGELLDEDKYNQILKGKQRRAGGAAKKFYQKTDVKQRLTIFIERYKAGSPTDATIFWVSKTPRQLACEFNKEDN